MDLPTITFDADGRVRVLDPEKYKATEDLEKEARTFLAKIQEFSGTVHSIVESLAEQAERIERAKLKAIGQRNLADGEKDARRRMQWELRALIDERTAELRRLTAEHESLLRVEASQREALEKLSANEPGGV